MTTCLTCSCGSAQVSSEANSEGGGSCLRCGQPIFPSENDETPTPSAFHLAEETQLFDAGTDSLHRVISLQRHDSSAETRFITPASDAGISDDFDVVDPAPSDAVTKVLDPLTKAGDDLTAVSSPNPSEVKGLGSSSPGSRRGSDGSRSSDIDLKQPIIASVWRSHLPPTSSQLDNGQYGVHRILREHQKGGMGRILIAYDQHLKREVALKALRPEVVDDLSIVQRFIGEAEVTAQLEHPGIVPIHMLGQNEGNPYYTMKLIKGHTLQDAIKGYHRRPSKTELMNLVRKLANVCKTMSFAHNKGMIHRDLKPANIMLSEHGETLVMDWGLAKSLLTPEEEIIPPTTTTEPISGVHREMRPELTMVGAVVGTLAFMSPEQATPESGTVGPLSDVFSLGAVLYYLLTGQTAFNGRSTQDILKKVRNATPIKPSLVKPYVPPDLEAVCLKAMNRDPVGRYQSADEMFDDLCRWLDNEPVQARKETFFQRTLRRIKRNRRVSMGIPTILILGVVMLAVGAVIDSIGRSRTEKETETAVLHHEVNLFAQPSVSLEGNGDISFLKERKRTGNGPPSVRIAIPREGEALLTITAPTGLMWDLTERQSLTFSLLEHESDGIFPLENFFVRLGKGSGYFEFRPTDDWWKKRHRGNWTTFSIPLNGSATWTKTVINDPSPDKIRWIEIHVEADKPTVFWIDGLAFTLRKNN